MKEQMKILGRRCRPSISSETEYIIQEYVKKQIKRKLDCLRKIVKASKSWKDILDK